MLHRGHSYDEVYGNFRWEVPERFNIGVAACDRHATGEGRNPQARPALGLACYLRADLTGRRHEQRSL